MENPNSFPMPSSGLQRATGGPLLSIKMAWRWMQSHSFTQQIFVKAYHQPDIRLVLGAKRWVRHSSCPLKSSESREGERCIKHGGSTGKKWIVWRIEQEKRPWQVTLSYSTEDKRICQLKTVKAFHAEGTAMWKGQSAQRGRACSEMV